MMRNIEVEHLKDDNIRHIEVKRLMNTKRVNVVRLNKINRKTFNSEKEYVLAFYHMSKNIKEMINIIKDSSILDIIKTYDISEYMSIYANSQTYEMKKKEYYNMFVYTSNNLIYIMDYLIRQGKEIIDLDLYDKFIYTHKLYSLFTGADINSYKDDCFVIKNYEIIDVAPKIKLNKNYKNSKVLIALDNDEYKAISYTYYKRLYKIKEFSICYKVVDISNMEDNYDEGSILTEFKRTTTELKDIFKMINEYKLITDFASIDLSSSYGSQYTTELDYVYVVLKNGDIERFTSVSSFINRYIPRSV